MSREYCQNSKKWINDLPYCSYYENVLCEDVKECPAHYDDDDEDNIGETYYDGEGEDDDEVFLLVIYKGIITELKTVVKVTKDGKTEKVILVTLDNGIHLKSDYGEEFYEKLQAAKQSKRMTKFTVDTDTNMITSVWYPDDC